MLVTASAEMSQCLEVISWGHREREREDGGGDKGEMGKEGKGINLIKNIFPSLPLDLCGFGAWQSC